MSIYTQLATVFFACATIAVLVTGCGKSESRHPNDATVKADVVSPRDLMRREIEAGNWQDARSASNSALIESPNDPDLLTDAARVAAMCDQKSDAAQLLAAAATASDFAETRVTLAIRALIDVGEFYKAIELLERAVAKDPKNTQLRRTLAGFLGEAQRLDKLQPHYRQIIRDRKFDIAFLVAMTETSSRRFAETTINGLLKRNPNDRRVRLGIARNLLDRRDAAAAQDVAQDILQHHPGFAPAHALLGQALMDQGLSAKIPDWMANATDECSGFPDYWLTLGDWAVEQDDYPAAARAYWEATNRDENNSRSWNQLAIALRKIAPAESPELLAKSLVAATSDGALQSIDQRVELLVELRNQFHQFGTSNRKSQTKALAVSRLLGSLGRYWEAEAWAAAALGLTEEPTDEVDTVRQSHIAALRADQSWVSTKQHPALQLDLSDVPSPDPTAGMSINQNKAKQPIVLPSVAGAKHLRLADETDLRGLVFSNGRDANASRVPPLMDSMGRGGAAIDFDLDGNADVMLAVAGGEKRKRNSRPNPLFRNSDGQFTEVSNLAKCGDTGFGQGIAVGDFNADGFPDVFIANIGQNRILRNNGDGTFADVSNLMQDDRLAWTTCGAIVDLDGDSLPDILNTNYCNANVDIESECQDSKTKKTKMCHPLYYPADSDQVLHQSGGAFIDTTKHWIGEQSPGRGLGMFVGHLDGSQMGALIANDMSANHFYNPKTTNQQTELNESATVRGVAVDARTLTQASMGIAGGDFDGDGDLDFYVTGFAREYNIYYEQDEPGFWRDTTAKQGLVESTLMTVGFGTEAVDIDSDGIDELVVTNGHLGELGPGFPPHAQPMQMFRRESNGKYQLVDIQSWGGYFASNHVGRALFTLDVNRDGRNDMVVTHDFEPVRLLTNETKTPNQNVVALKLVGTKCEREAIGAIVRFECGNRKRVLWCTAGDGYMCSNERVLRAGLGTNNTIKNVVVTWPDGETQDFGNLQANAEYNLVQGETDAFKTSDFK